MNNFDRAQMFSFGDREGIAAIRGINILHSAR